MSKNVKNSDIRNYIYSFALVLYGSETWSLILREENRLKVIQKRLLRRISGLKRDEITGGWRKLHNEELRKIYSSPNIIIMTNSWMTQWSGVCSTHGGEQECM
jgi:hypothetical protein